MPINELKKLPHYKGQLVLHGLAPEREIKTMRDTVEEVRGTALSIRRQPI